MNGEQKRRERRRPRGIENRSCETHIRIFQYVIKITKREASLSCHDLLSQMEK